MLGEAYREHELGLGVLAADPGQALAHWTRAAALAPGNEELTFWRAVALASAGQRTEARQILLPLSAGQPGMAQHAFAPSRRRVAPRRPGPARRPAAGLPRCPAARPLTGRAATRYFTKYQFSGLMLSVALCGRAPFRLLAISVSWAAASGAQISGSWEAR